MTGMRLLVSLILLTGTSASTLSVAGVPFNGKSGQVLLSSVAAYSRPDKTVDKGRLSLTITDTFNDRVLEVASGNLPQGYVWSTLVPVDWWENAVEVFGTSVSEDIYNLLPANGDVVSFRKDLPPGEVTESEFKNSYWSAGRGELFGVQTELYSPPEKLRGELARAYFYMSTVYHVDTWSARAFMMMTSAPYPGLTNYAIPLLLAWHRAYPPSEWERQRNGLGEELQGNRNPFVDYPSLAEHIWGDRAGEPFVVEGEPVPLKGAYSIDEVIDFYSPEVPSDALWSVDGRIIYSTSLPASELGVGDHILEYSSKSARESGIVMIKIHKS